MNDVEQLYSFPSFIKIEHDDSISVDGQVTDADIISPIEFTKVFVLPYSKIDPIEHLNRDVQGEYHEVKTFFFCRMHFTQNIYFLVHRRNNRRDSRRCCYTKYRIEYLGNNAS